jgi:hypothetical protein
MGYTNSVCGAMYTCNGHRYIITLLKTLYFHLICHGFCIHMHYTVVYVNTVCGSNNILYIPLSIYQRKQFDTTLLTITADSNVRYLCVAPGGSLGLEVGTHVRKQNRVKWSVFE